MSDFDKPPVVNIENTVVIYFADLSEFNLLNEFLIQNHPEYFPTEHDVDNEHIMIAAEKDSALFAQIMLTFTAMSVNHGCLQVFKVK